MRLAGLLRLALAGALRARLRSALTILGVAVASGALVSMLALALGLEERLVAPFHELGLLRHIRVQPADPDEESPEDSRGDPTPILDDAAIARLETIPGVEAAWPDLRLASVSLRRNDAVVTARAIALPREAGMIPAVGDVVVAGRLFSIGTAPEIVLSDGLVTALGFASAREAIGEPVEIAASGLVRTDPGSFELRKDALELRVAGVFRPPGFARAFAGDMVLVPVDILRNLPGAEVGVSRGEGPDRLIAPREGWSRATVRVENASDALRVEEEIQGLGFDARAVVRDLEEARSFFLLLDVLLASVGTVALLVAGLGILNTLLMAVMERTSEIGLYKAVGASDGDIRIVFLIEAAVVGLLGAVAGLFLARGTCAVLAWAVDLWGESQGVEGPIIAFEFPPWLIAGAIFFTLLLSVASGVWPASRAARLDPIRALHGER